MKTTMVNCSFALPRGFELKCHKSSRLMASFKDCSVERIMLLAFWQYPDISTHNQGLPSHAE